MKTLALLTGLLAANVATAASADSACMPMSEYQFQVTPEQVIAMSESRAPHSVVLKGGKLFVANEWVTLSAADQQRVRDIEKSIRALEPKIQAENERTGAEQYRAFSGLANRGATADSNDAYGQWRAQAQRDRAEKRFRIGPMSAWQSPDGAKVMEGMAGSMIGVMADLLGQMRNMRKGGSEADVEGIFRNLPVPNIGANLQTQLCKEYRALNDLDNALTFRHQGEPLELIRVMEPNFR